MRNIPEVTQQIILCLQQLYEGSSKVMIVGRYYDVSAFRDTDAGNYKVTISDNHAQPHDLMSYGRE